ncbi:MAG: DUF2959 domain-containing protein [Phycisphaeraceae bacterium]
MNRPTPAFAGLALALALLPLLAGCQTAYYKTMETFGYEKRDILVDRVESARDQQQDAKEQFTSALEQFKSVVAFDGGDLEDMYDKLDRDYQRSEKAADAVSGKIESVDKVANALFDEWEDELDEYENAELRDASEKQLEDTRDRYAQMLKAMRKAEATMPPVLSAMKDQVLFLKHNLNAQAVASIQGTAEGIQRDIESLIREMQRSIDEANAFIDEMGGG